MDKMDDLKEKYIKEIVPALKEELGLENDSMVPNLEKIVVNVGLGESITNPQSLAKMSEDLAIITGQKPLVTKAKRAISNFNLRSGQEIGLKVTLRRDRMWNFFQKLVSIALPRVRDFRGLSRGSFDGFGNFALGIKEHSVFPEIDPNEIDKLRSFEIIIVTTAQKDEDGLKLLEKLGMPFAKADEAKELEKMKEVLKREKKELSKVKAQRLAEGKKVEERRKTE